MKPVRNPYCVLYLAFTFLVFLASCSPSPVIQPSLTSPPPTATFVSPSSTPTQVPPTSTETPIPPTSKPTRIPSRTPNLITESMPILGIWLGIENNAGMYYQFNDDGTYWVAKSLKLLESQPNVTGNYFFEGEKITFKMTSVHDLPDCGWTDSVYKVEKLLMGQIKFIKVEDRCSERVRTMTQIHEKQP